MSRDCLLLNGNGKPVSFFPLSVINWKTAIKLLLARNVILIKAHDDQYVRSPSISVELPSILMLKRFHKFHNYVKFSRSNVLLRDMYTCQYCSEIFDKKDLTLDHVIPKSKKGPSNWENVVTACKSCNLKKGDKLTIFGPFGEFMAKDTQNEMVFIGGGAGMAPMRSHIFDQLLRLNSSRKISFWYGARSLKEMFYDEEFRELEKKYENFSYHTALSDPLPEDSWSGYTGFISHVLHDNYLVNHPTPEDCEYYMCGPPMMMDAAFKMLDSLGVEPENIMFDDFGG